MANIFRFYQKGDKMVPTESGDLDFDHKEFWKRLIKGDITYLKKTKSSNIHNPCLHYTQKVMDHFVFGRGDNT